MTKIPCSTCLTESVCTEDGVCRMTPQPMTKEELEIKICADIEKAEFSNDGYLRICVNRLIDTAEEYSTHQSQSKDSRIAELESKIKKLEADLKSLQGYTQLGYTNKLTTP